MSRCFKQGKRRAGESGTKGRTPVRVEKMHPFLDRYPDREAAQVLGQGFSDGFRIPASLVISPPMARNLHSVLQHPEGVSEKLRKKVALGRMAGFFSVLPMPDLVVSPLGVVPKKEPLQYRLIHHLSFPKGGLVNYAIDPKM